MVYGISRIRNDNFFALNRPVLIVPSARNPA